MRGRLIVPILAALLLFLAVLAGPVMASSSVPHRSNPVVLPGPGQNVSLHYTMELREMPGLYDKYDILCSAGPNKWKVIFYSLGDDGWVPGRFGIGILKYNGYNYGIYSIIHVFNHTWSGKIYNHYIVQFNVTVENQTLLIDSIPVCHGNWSIVLNFDGLDWWSASPIPAPARATPAQPPQRDRLLLAGLVAIGLLAFLALSKRW